MLDATPLIPVTDSVPGNGAAARDEQRFLAPRLLRIDFDQYQRYRCSSEIILSLLRGRPPFRLLEVGSNAIDLYPGFLGPRCRQVIRTDFIDMGNDPGYVRLTGDGPMPFPDGSFEVVAALEVLEHMPAGRRASFLDDCLRIASEVVVLSCPRGEADVVQAEEAVSRFYLNTYGVAHPFLAEHLEFALPTPAEMTALLQRTGLPWCSLENSYLPNWVAMCILTNLLVRTPSDWTAIAPFNEFYNRRFYRDTCASPGYRTLFVVTKSAGLLPQPIEPWREGFVRPGASQGLLDESSLISAGWVTSEYLRHRQEHDLPLNELREIAEQRVSGLEHALARIREQTGSALEREQAFRLLIARAPAPSRDDPMARRLAQQDAEIGRLHAEIARLQGEISWRAATVPPVLRGGLRGLVQRLVAGDGAAAPPAAAATPVEARLNPNHEVIPHPSPDEFSWQSLGKHPALFVAGPIPTGWVRVTLEARSEFPSRATLHIDEGHGMTGDAIVALGRVGRESRRIERVCWIGPRAVGLRLDPIALSGGFSARLTLTPIAAAVAVPEALRLLSAHAPFAREGQARYELKLVWLGDLVERGEGAAEIRQALRDHEREANHPYYLWLRERALALPSPETVEAELAAWPAAPLISVLLPVYETPEPLLEEAIRSVRAQLYPRWELCAVDDSSRAPHVREILERHRAQDSRVKVIYRDTNGGISAASNDALGLASGPYVALFDHDDLLTPDALLEMARATRAHPAADMFYSDEDKVDEVGWRWDPFFKPTWSPDYFLSCMYTCHLGVYRTQALRDIGGFRTRFDQAQDYDLVLRLTQTPREVVHVPRILYSWRAHAGSTAASSDSKPRAHVIAEEAIAEHVKPLGGHLNPSHASGFHRVAYPVRGRPLVSVVVATAGAERRVGGRQLDLVANLVEALAQRTGYREIEVIVTAASWLSDATVRRLGQAGARILGTHTPSTSIAALVNRGIADARGEHVLLLHDDIEPIGRDWLEHLIGYSQLDEVGAVGAKMLLPDGRLQHCGVVVVNGVPRLPYHGVAGEDHGHFMSSLVPRNWSAVSGACLMTRRAVITEIGGFDEDLPVGLSDSDYCLKLRGRGLRVVCTPGAELYHFECGAGETDVEARVVAAGRERFRARWRDLGVDPYYNPNLAQHAPTFEVGL